MGWGDFGTYMGFGILEYKHGVIRLVTSEGRKSEELYNYINFSLSSEIFL